MGKAGEILKNIITLIIWLLVVGSIGFAVYVYLIPEPIVIIEKHYDSITKSNYNVDENELNGEWLSIQLYEMDKNDLNRYEDLKDFYKGRDNPFADLNGIREEIYSTNDENNQNTDDPINPENPDDGSYEEELE